MHFRFFCRATLICASLSAVALYAQPGKSISAWLTTPDRSSLFSQQPEHPRFRPLTRQVQVIEVNDKQKYQSMDGFGFALTGGSAQLLMRMDTPPRIDLLKELFGTGDGEIGISYLRVSIGSSDMNDHAFTYDDLSSGETDKDLSKFDLGPDSTSVVPVLKEILAINPSIKI